MLNDISTYKRIIAFFIDMLIITLAYIIIIILLAFLIITFNIKAPDFKFKEFPLLIPLIVLILLKDIFKGRSIGKIITKLQITDIKGKRVTNVFKLMIRNILLAFWPIEFIAFFLIFRDGQRIGDKIFKTKVIQV